MCIVIIMIIIIIGSLQPVNDLKVSRNATHLNFKWRPPPVLDGIQVNYSLQLFHEDSILINQTVTQTHFSILSVCPPCLSSKFSVTPLAGQLRGAAKYITRPVCTKG